MGAFTLKNQELVHFPELVHQKYARGHAITNLPAGSVKRFAEGSDNEAFFAQMSVTRHTMMGFAIVDQMLIYFIA